MKIKSLLFTFVLAIFFGMVLPRQAEARVTFSYFYDSLQPYGEWVDVDTYGYCWQPRGMERDWRPYTDGYWSYTDAGWTWISYEDFGSITYHYGRWVNLEDYGWVWKPDYEWGPAWVSWRQSDDYIGWAPLPPEAVFESQTGIGVWVDRDYDIGPSAYAFCEYRYFGAPVMRNVLIPRHRNVAIINSTVNITNITVITGNGQGRMVFNGGLNYAQVAARSQNRIEALQLVRQTDGDWAQHHRSELSRRVGTQLFINAPEVEAPKTRFAPAMVSQQIHAPKIDTGWAGVSNPAEREQIKARYHEQTRGLTRATAPAWTLNTTQAQTMMNEARTHQKTAPQPAAAQVPQSAATPLPMQIQQPTPVQREHSRQKEQPQGQVPQPAATPLPMQIQQPTPVQREHARQKEQPQGQVPQPAATPLPMQIQQPTPVQREHARQKEQPQEQVIQPVEPKIQQVQQAEQQRKAAEAEARAAREQQAQAQRAQQAQAQAEQQRRAAEVEARAAREQQMQAQRAQQAQAQAEQQRRAAEAEARAAREQQMQAQRAQQEQAAKQVRQPQPQEQKQATAPDKRKHEGPGPSPTP